MKKLFSRGTAQILKNVYYLKNNVFLIYASRNAKVEPTEFGRIDSGILAFIPKNSCSFITFREDEINEIYSGNQRLWVETLNKSCEFPIEIKKAVF